MSKERYNLTIEPLTAVHIGTGETLTPVDYGVFGGQYLKYNQENIISRLIRDNNRGERLKYEQAANKNDMKSLRNFFEEIFENENDENDDFIYECDTTKSFRALYKNNKEKNPLQNASEVLSIYRPEGSHKPVIPGSSIKGAIRTAVLNALSGGKDYLDEKRFEKDLLSYNDAKSDPFRCIAIGDFTFKSAETQIVGIMEQISKNADPKTAAQVLIEAIRGTLIDGKAISASSLLIDKDLQKNNVDIKIPLSINDIRKSCNDFYWSEFEEEYREFYQNCLEKEKIGIVEKLREKLQKARDEDNTFIIRCGRYSQVEFMTLQGHRKPKTRKDKFGKPYPWGTTRTVFDYDGKLVPLGWIVAKLEPTND